MKRRFVSACPILAAIPLLFIAMADTGEKNPPKARKFEFSYSATIKGLPLGNHRVRVWIPLASSDRNQEVVVKKISSPVPTRITRDTEYGNRTLYAEVVHSRESNALFSLEYEVTRREYSKGGYDELMQYNNDSMTTTPSLARFLKPDLLVPVGGKLRTLADEHTQGKRGPVEKAYALYDYVFRTLRYDKSGAGWGRGDALWACDAKHGNCTDFHSLFIAMMRAEKIPARFEIGFPLPEGSTEGEIPGYHCWAEFYLAGAGWVPVDISEAWKNPSRHDYFFGTLDANRVKLTVGRDLALTPRQDGPLLNYFVYPYVEVDGKPYQDLERKFSFREDSVQGGNSAGR